MAVGAHAKTAPDERVSAPQNCRGLESEGRCARSQSSFCVPVTVIPARKAKTGFKESTLARARLIGPPTEEPESITRAQQQLSWQLRNRHRNILHGAFTGCWKTPIPRLYQLGSLNKMLEYLRNGKRILESQRLGDTQSNFNSKTTDCAGKRALRGSQQRDGHTGS